MINANYFKLLLIFFYFLKRISQNSAQNTRSPKIRKILRRLPLRRMGDAKAISYTEALNDFLGTWCYNSKRSKEIPPGYVKAKKIMQRAKLSMTKRIGFQYFVGDDVSQNISVDEELGLVYIEAHIKGILAWEKYIYLDRSPRLVKDSLFGRSTSWGYYDGETKVFPLISFNFIL